MTMMTTRRIAGLALAACLTLAWTETAGAQLPTVAVVYRLLQGGDLSVKSQGAAARPGRIGDVLRNGDEVATGANTRAALRFSEDRSILRLNPNSTVLLSSGTVGGVLVRTLRMELGEVWVRVNRRDGTTLRVSTPAGVAAVKGTEFLVRVDAERVTTVITLEGVVEFFHQGGRVDRPAGSKVVAADSAAVPRAVPATADDRRQAEEVRGEEGGDVRGAWVEVELRNATGQTRKLMLQVPADALRQRVEGRP
jgi:hypothetical protein